MAANYVKFCRGTPKAFERITPNIDTLYFIAEKGEEVGVLYLGSQLIAGASTIQELSNVLVEHAKDGQLLVYDEIQQSWVNKYIGEIAAIMQGATSISVGKAGLVPAPGKGDQNKFLRGDGKWAEVVGGGVNSDGEWVGGATAQVFDTTILQGENHQRAIEKVVNATAVNNGDIAIVKEYIVEAFATGEEKYEYTAYVYEHPEWIAMDGNYNAENVYFDSDIIVTTKVGTIDTLVNGKATLQAKGKNVKEVLTTLLAQQKVPKITLPKATIRLTNAVTSLEIGTKVIPTWAITFDPGLYEFGPPTGVRDRGGVISPSKGAAGATVPISSLNGATGSLPEYEVTDSSKYQATLRYSWFESTVTPVDNLGEPCFNPSENMPIQGQLDVLTESSNYIQGYRKWFKGGLKSNSSTFLTSDLIRSSLDHSSTGATSQTFEMLASSYPGCKRIVIAIPADTGIRVKEVWLKSASNADILSEFKLQAQTVKVEGANGYKAIPYNVWVYEPAKLDSTEVYTITLG